MKGIEIFAKIVYYLGCCKYVRVAPPSPFGLRTGEWVIKVKILLVKVLPIDTKLSMSG